MTESDLTLNIYRLMVKP